MTYGFLRFQRFLDVAGRNLSPLRHCSKRSWTMGKLNHVAIAVPSMSKAVNMYKNVLNGVCSGEQKLESHGVTTVFVDLGNTKIELLESLGENSPIKGFLDKNSSGGIHHICIEVDDIKATVKDLTKNGVRILTKEPVIGAHGKPVIFCHPKDMGGVLVEFEEA